jgi:hypothetical protein
MPARKDTLISLEAVRKTASRMRDARLVALPIGHFEIYADGPFEQAVEIQADFLAEHFRMKAS